MRRPAFQQHWANDAARASPLQFFAGVKVAVILVVVSLTAPALAEDEPPAPAPDPDAAGESAAPTDATADAAPIEPGADEPTARDVAGAPLPGQESGRVDAPKRDSLWRDVGQGLLTPPRVALEVAMAPVRATVWTVDRYQLIDRYKQIFFDETMTYGVYPTFVLDSSYGATFGAEFVHRNLFGEREELELLASTGGEYRLQFEAGFLSGYRLGTRTVLDIRGEYERRPKDNFFGIGNNTEEDMETHFRQEMRRARASLSVRAIRSFYITASGAITDLSFDPSTDEPSIQTVFDVMNLTGWTTGASNVYGELELSWDSRRYPTRLDRHGIYSNGGYLALWAGPVIQLESAGGNYWRYGGDAQAFWQLGMGPRVLSARVHVDAVSGDYEDVVFTQLPELGGKYYLRGYSRERFRDRAAVIASAEYTWDLGQLLMASLFTDVGRVYPSLGELHYKDLRVGYGVSFQLHRRRDFLAAISFASSIDGGFFVDVIFDPVYEVEPRVEQR